MISKQVLPLVITAMLLGPAVLHAQPTNDDQIRAALQKMQHDIPVKAAAGKTNESDYADELKTLDTMIAAKKDAKTDEAVQFTYMKAMLYLEAIKNYDKGAAIMRQIITNYPNTAYSESATKIVARIEGQEAEQKADQTYGNSEPSPALSQVIKNLQAKIDADKTSESDYADELKTLDQMIGDYKGTNVDEIVGAAMNKTLVYLMVFRNFDQAAAIVKEIETHYPDTKYASQADELGGEIVQLKFQDAEMKSQMSHFPVGQPLRGFDKKDLEGKPVSLASLKGKIVMLDFWATWCGPCVAELPNVIATYQKYHNQGLEIIGVTSDDDQHQLAAFLQKHDGMTWQQYFDGKGSDNDLATQYSVKLIPFTVLLDREGKVIATNLRGPSLQEAVAKAVATK